MYTYNIYIYIIRNVRMKKGLTVLIGLRRVRARERDRPSDCPAGDIVPIIADPGIGDIPFRKIRGTLETIAFRRVPD